MGQLGIRYLLVSKRLTFCSWTYYYASCANKPLFVFLTVILTPQSAASVVSATSSVTDISQTIQTNHVYKTVSTVLQVSQAIRDIVYPRKKILSNLTDDLGYSINPNSVCYLILDHVQRQPSVDTIINRAFWQAHKSMVSRVLNLKRATVIFAIRKKFQGTEQALRYNSIHCALHYLY